MKNKISYKLIFYIFIISFAITSISVYVQLTSTYEKEISSFEEDINNIEKHRISILTESLWNLNTKAINIFLQNLVNDKKIIYAKVEEPDNFIFALGKQKKENTIIKEFNIYKQLKSEKQFLGKLTIVADLDPLHEQLKNYAISMILTEIIKIFFISLFIIFVIKRFLTNKIEIMAEYANKLNLDNLKTPLPLKDAIKENHDEIDTVVLSIETMRKNLLKEINQNKEKDTILAHQSKMAAMGEMIGNIAHQWRQPLSVISAASTGLKLKHELNLLEDSELTTSLDAMNDSAQYLSTTIDDFRDFFKPNKEKKHFNISEVFESVFSLVSQQYKNIEITINKDIKEITLFGFKNELIQVLINILNNARDALLKEKTDNRVIGIESYIEDEKAIILIKDNAGGIEKELISRIFEPYFTTKDKSQGTGIGLYICEEIIVKHMDGSILVENIDYDFNGTTSRGVQFKITLPLSNETLYN